ncbi:MAG: hypothetical protein AAGD14_09800 [Planctomycetota bacterium]
MKKIGMALAGYGVFLIVVGLIGYLSNPEKAKTALMSGGTFGLLNIGLGLLAMRGWKASATIALVVACLLGAVFAWRSTVTWRAYAGGAEEKFLAGVLISSMLVASVFIVIYLLRSKRTAA